MNKDGSQGKTQGADIYIWIVAPICALVCIAFLVAHFVCGLQAFLIDGTALLLLFGGMGFLFLPCLSKFKIVGLVEMERLRDRVDEVREVILRGEVVRTRSGRRYYIDSEGKRYSMSDDQTARFLSSARGEVAARQEELESYPLVGDMDSVLNCYLLQWSGHVFAILNGKKYHVASASHLADWERPEDYKPCDDECINQYPTER